MGGVCTGGLLMVEQEVQAASEDDSLASPSREFKASDNTKRTTTRSSTTTTKMTKKQKKNKLTSSFVVRSISKSPKLDCNSDSEYRKSPPLFDHLSFSRELTPSAAPRNSGDTKKLSFLGKAGIAGLERAVGVLDVLGSGMTNLNSGGFASTLTAKGNKISVLAFEVANTITKAVTLAQSLSEENIRFVKEQVLLSEGVHNLVSTDTKMLLRIAAQDKRVELRVFCQEVIRFGDLCKDPQWHNLDRFFTKLDSENPVHKPAKEEAERKMHELAVLAQYTSELYHELNALDRFEHEYHQKMEELRSLNLPHRGEGITMLHNELRQQRKLVWSLKKKSLWSKKLEEIIEKLVDIVAFVHHKISRAFGLPDSTEASQEPDKDAERLGIAGLALHYANMINQIDNLASRPACVPPSIRDSLYQGLPICVKAALKSSLRRINGKEEFAVPEIKLEMEKILQWLVPVAANTTKMHQGFGWVGEWANTSNELVSKKTPSSGNLIRLQTLYHAEKQKADQYLLQLVTWLHRLIAAVKQKDEAIFKPLSLQSPSNKGMILHSSMKERLTMHDANTNTAAAAATTTTQKVHVLSEEEQNLLVMVSKRGPALIRSRSQEYTRTNRRANGSWASSRSLGRYRCGELRSVVFMDGLMLS